MVVAIWYKESLQLDLKFLDHKNNDYIWIRLCKDVFNLAQDTYICMAHIPPENSTFYKSRGESTLHHNERDIMKYCNIVI